MTLPTRFTLPCALLLFAAGPGLFADDYDKKTDVTISAPVEVPGGVILKPGMYKFKLLNITANRHVVQISSEDGKKTYAIVMTAAARRTEPTDKTVLTFYETPGDSPQAVRRWFWPGDLDGQEFLYPHKRAGEISTLAKQTVPEAPEDQQEQIAAATANQSAAAATPSPAPESATPAPDTTVSTSATVTTAEVTPAPVDTTPAPDPALLAQANPPANAQPAPAPSDQPIHTSSDDAALPQTASELPLITLLGFAALMGIVMLRGLRRA